MAKRQQGERQRQLHKQVIAASDVCYLCGHPGADSADHVVPVYYGGRTELSNLRPAHQRACPTCGKRCNQSKGTRPPTMPTSRDW